MNFGGVDWFLSAECWKTQLPIIVFTHHSLFNTIYIYQSWFLLFNFCGQSSFNIYMYLPIIIYRLFMKHNLPIIIYQFMNHDDNYESHLWMIYSIPFIFHSYYSIHIPFYPTFPPTISKCFTKFSINKSPPSPSWQFTTQDSIAPIWSALSPAERAVVGVGEITLFVGTEKSGREWWCCNCFEELLELAHGCFHDFEIPTKTGVPCILFTCCFLLFPLSKNRQFSKSVLFQNHEARDLAFAC